MINPCPFCGLDQPDSPVTKPKLNSISRNGHVVWHFEPLDPVTPGHLLFVPQQHSWDHRLIGEVFAVATEFATTCSARDFNLVISSGPDATQTVPHPHVHYVPRRPGDGLLLPWGGPR